MSTPFPLEEQAQTNNMRGEWNPWKGPADPHWYSGMGFNDESHYLGPFGRALDAAGAGAAKGEAVLGGLIHEAQQPGSAPSQGFEQPETKPAFPELGSEVEADAKMRVQAMTPNPTTTGSAAQLLHGLVSGFTEMSIGGLAAGAGGAAAVVGSSEGVQRYNELIDAGVDPDTARKSALLTGSAAAAGAVVPAGVGASLAAKVASGAVGNTIFGVANRYADHKILESAGYPEMAEQQKVIDGTQVITDLILGAAFGGLAHVHETAAIKALQDAPGAREAALTTNLAIKDRESAPGIPADPEAANAHQSALESSIADMMQGKAVDVSDSGVTESKFVQRPESRAPEVQDAVRESIKETGLFGEANEQDIDALLQGHEIEPRTEPQVSAEGKWMADGKPIWEMSADELGAHADKLDAESVDTLTSIFGNQEDAAKFHRLANSERDSAYYASEKMVEGLPEDKQRLIAHWETGGGPNALNGNEVRDLEKAVRSMHAVESPAELAEKLKYSLTKIGDATDPRSMDNEEMQALLETKAAHEVAIENGWDLKEISEQAIKSAAARFSDPNDAEFMLRRFLKEPGKAPEGEAIKAPALKQVEGPKLKPAEAKPGEPTAEQAPEAETVSKVLDDKPDLTIPDENGQPISAREAMEKANEEVATTRKESTIAAKAAITCYMRRGN